MSSIQSVPGQPGGRVGTEGEAPGLGVVAAREVGRALQVGPGGRVVERVDAGVVPNEALESGLDEHAHEVAVDCAQVDERGHGVGLVLRHVDRRRQILERAVPGEFGHLAGARKPRDIRRMTLGYALPEEPVQVARARVVDGDAGVLLEGPDHGQEGLLLAATPRPDHLDGATDRAGGRGLTTQKDANERQGCEHGCDGCDGSTR